VLDAYGHLSVRHPSNPEIFIMSRYIAPGTISSDADLIQYNVSDASPVDANAAPGYSERCIHSEVLKKFPEVQAVIHSHSEAVVPYTISGVPMRACYHMAGFLGTKTPVYDIGKYYQPDDRKDMLVRNVRLGAALASYFASVKSSESPDHAVVLMRGHGFTVQGSSIEDVVLRAVYTQQNASILTTALTTRAAFFCAGMGDSAREELPDVHYLSEEETKGSTEMTRWSAMRPWR